MKDELDETSATDLTADEETLLKEMPTLTDVGQSRRRFLGQTIAGGLGVFALDLLAHEEALAALSPSPGAVFAAETRGGEPRQGRAQRQRRDEDAGDRLARRAARCVARTARADRLEEGLRPGAVRRLHGARRRTARAVVPDARGERRGPAGHDDRGAREGRSSCTRCRPPSSSTTASSAGTARLARSVLPSRCSRRRAAAMPVT